MGRNVGKKGPGDAVAKRKKTGKTKEEVFGCDEGMTERYGESTMATLDGKAERRKLKMLQTVTHRHHQLQIITHRHHQLQTVTHRHHQLQTVTHHHHK